MLPTAISLLRVFRNVMGEGAASLLVHFLFYEAFVTVGKTKYLSLGLGSVENFIVAVVLGA